MDLIKNKDILSSTRQREQALFMIEAGLAAVEPKKLVYDAVKYNKDFNSLEVHNKIHDILSGRIFVIGAGKAVGAMAEGIERIIGADNIAAGYINTLKGDYKTNKIKTTIAGHPLPDKDGIKGVKRMLELKQNYKIGEHDLVVCLLSGGASSMLVSPKEGLSLEDKQDAARLLLECGADIGEVNIVRKHLSAVKGGQLADFFYPAKVVSIIISDVVGNDPAVIGSGPTVPDPSSYKDAIRVIAKYKLQNKMPKTAIDVLNSGFAGQLSDTPKRLENVQTSIIGKNSIALEAMAYAARNLGLKPIIVSAELGGKPLEAAKRIAGDISSGEYKGYNCLLYGGETYPALPEDYKKGGRNQHMAALSSALLSGLEKKWTGAWISSDGRDYVKGIGGAIVDSGSLKPAEAEKIDWLRHIKEYDSYGMFKKMGNCLIETDETGTNVGDLAVYLIED